MKPIATVGMIGAGLMGRGIAGNLLAAGFGVSILVHRNRAPLEALFAAGAKEAASIADMLAGVDAVITCLPSLKAVGQVYDGDDGVLAHLRSDMLVIDCTTNAPDETRRLAAACAKRGAEFVDAPLAGGPKQAADRSLRYLVGASERGLAMARPILEATSSGIIHAGPVGSGQTLKILNNGVGLMSHAAICEAMVLARKCGIDPAMLQAVLSGGPHASRKLMDLTTRLIEDDHAMAFAVGPALKDANLFVRLATEVGVPTYTAQGMRNTLELASAMGFDEENNSRVATALERLVGIEEK